MRASYIPHFGDGDEVMGVYVLVTDITESKGAEAEINRLHALLAEPDISNLVVDFSTTRYLSSIIIGAIIALCKKTCDDGGKAALCNASDGMYDQIQIMKLDTVFPYFPSRGEAIDSLLA